MIRQSCRVQRIAAVETAKQLFVSRSVTTGRFSPGARSVAALFVSTMEFQARTAAAVCDLTAKYTACG
jgi:hypothetical protein